MITNFWEIMEGHDAKFWNDSWQQLLKIISHTDIQASWTGTKESGLTKIH